MAKDNSDTNCKTCQLSFKKLRADNVFCSKKCRDKDSYGNNKEKTKLASTIRLLDPQNRADHNKAQLRWAHKNFNKRKDAALKYHYNITLDDYNLKYQLQEGKCNICSTFKEVLHVDHCHVTLKVRGLLCGKCNKALGLFKDKTDILNKAIEYLRLHEEES